MTETDTDTRARAFDMWRSMMADASPDATIVEFRQGYDSMFSRLEVDPEAVVTEVDADGVRCLQVSLPSVSASADVVYFHGGGYMCGNPDGVVGTAARIARAAHARVHVPDYRLAPENAYPAAHDDAVTMIRWLLSGGARASRLALVGDSAGGGLALSSVVTLRADASQVPAAIVVWSPWVDMEVSGETMKSHADVDPIASAQSLTMSSQAYLQGQDPQTPTANVLCADLAGFPPISIHVGGAEVLLDDALRLARRAALANVEVSLRVAPGLPHVYQYFAEFLPEAQQSIEETGAFILAHLG